MVFNCLLYCKVEGDDMNSAHKLTSKKIVTLGIIVFFMLLIAYMLYTNRLEAGVFLSSHNDYAPTWSLDYATADEENRTLEVSFDSNILKGREYKV
jgi:hypothetical protein